MVNKVVYVIGGGPSLAAFDFSLLRDKDVIVVNRAIYNLPQAKYFITCDYSFTRKVPGTLFKNLKDTTKIFVANMMSSDLKESQGRIVHTRFNQIYDLAIFDMIIKSYKREGIGDSFHEFRSGTNSGYCALQLAYLLGYTRIVLLGLDFVVEGGRTHFHDGYGAQPAVFAKKLLSYFKVFEEGLIQAKTKFPETKVFSCSKISRLNNIIPYKHIEEGLRIE